MIDSVLNLILCCPHKHLTRPVTPITTGGKPLRDTYVVCLACGKQFSYDVKKMRIGKPLPRSANSGALSAGLPVQQCRPVVVHRQGNGAGDGNKLKLNR